MDWYRLLPNYWQQNYPTNLAWDKRLNELLDTKLIRPVDAYQIRLGTTFIWIGNWPYSFGYKIGSVPCLPTVKTRKRLLDAIASL